MAYVYEKVTKNTVDFPAYTLCFLGIIMDKLEFYGFIDGKPKNCNAPQKNINTLIIPIVSEKFQYCYDGVSLIEKTMKRRGFNCKMTKYKIVDIKKNDGSKITGYSYEYKVSKL